MKRTNKEQSSSGKVWDQEVVLAPSNSAKPLLVTIKQAQYMLGSVSDKTVRRMIKDGRLSRAMFSRKILIPFQEVERVAKETNLTILEA